MSAASSEHNLSPALGDTDAAALTTTKPKFWYGSPTPTNGLSPIDSQRRVSSVGGGIDGADSIAGGATTSVAGDSTAPLKQRSYPGTGNLLLKETRDGFTISPALHRRRLLTGYAQAQDDADTRIKKTAANSSPTVHSPREKGVRRITPRGRPHRRHGFGKRKGKQHSAVEESGAAGNGGGGGWFNDAFDTNPTLAPAAQQNRVRASTWTGPEINKYTAAKGNPGQGGSLQEPGEGKGLPPEWEHLDAFQAMGSMFQQELYHEKMSGFMEILGDRMQVPLLIILVGIMAAFVGMVVGYCSSTARLWRINWTAAHQDAPFLWLEYGTISLVLTACMCAITHYTCPTAAGGGVPEIKAVLSGAGRPGLLTARLVVVKSLGVIVTNAAGLSVGKEGPLIHITCAIADTLMSTEAFRSVRLNTTKRLEVLACACAAGVAATFGSVFGGTLFSVEVTATAYRVHTLPTTFFCAVVVAVVFWMTGTSEFFTLLDENSLQAEGFSPADLLAWCLLGVVCGLVGAAFVAILSTLSAKRNYFLRKTLPYNKRKMRTFLFVAGCTLLVIPSAYLDAVAFTDLDVRRRFFSPFVDRIYETEVFGTSWKLTQLLLLTTWSTIFSVIQPLPLGLFSPVFIIGGLIGRVFGEAAHWMDKDIDSFDINFKPWEFALIGSAAFAGGVTRAVSTAVIVFELSGQNHLRLPLGVALMISYFIANWFTKGIYDALMDTNGTPYLYEVGPEDRNVPAESVMVPLQRLPHLALGSTGKDASKVVADGRPGQVIPIVQAMNDKVLVGVVLWNDLAIALADYRRRGRMDTSAASRSEEQKRAVEHFGSSSAFASSARDRLGSGNGGWPNVRGDNGLTDGVGHWPKLPSVAKAIGKRVGWLPRMRLAAPALLEQLDQETTSGLDHQGACHEGEFHQGAASGLPPLVPGRTSRHRCASEDIVGGGLVSAGHGEKSPLLTSSVGGNGGGGGGGSSTHDPHGFLASLSENRGSEEGEGEKYLASLFIDDSAGISDYSKGGRASYPSTSSVTNEFKRAERAHLRFFLVREGHKFVPVGGNRRRGAWRELPGVAKSHGIPVVLDPSPYQVSHTTELAKVDLAFRLLKVENAYVCNAGRLVGVITRESLRRFMQSRQISPMDECLSLCGSFSCCMPSSEENESVYEASGETPDEAPVPTAGGTGTEPLPDDESWSNSLPFRSVSYSSESDGDKTGFKSLVSWFKRGSKSSGGYTRAVEMSDDDGSVAGGMVGLEGRGYGSAYTSRVGWDPL